jgi:resuscitation-promoting factor RpfB
MLPSFGFNQTTQWSCLEQLWTRESGWRWDAENPDGAYGIPQSFPGSKMASAGADWQTDPTTQIKWGLTYITDTYGTPCGAWDQEESTGGY